MRTIDIDGVKHNVNEVPVFQCANCERETLTALCGCEKPTPKQVGTTYFATPMQKP